MQLRHYNMESSLFVESLLNSFSVFVSLFLEGRISLVQVLDPLVKSLVFIVVASSEVGLSQKIEEEGKISKGWLVTCDELLVLQENVFEFLDNSINGFLGLFLGLVALAEGDKSNSEKSSRILTPVFQTQVNEGSSLGVLGVPVIRNVSGVAEISAEDHTFSQDEALINQNRDLLEGIELSVLFSLVFSSKDVDILEFIRKLSGSEEELNSISAGGDVRTVEDKFVFHCYLDLDFFDIFLFCYIFAFLYSPKSV
jgi:hypothetical protein